MWVSISHLTRVARARRATRAAPPDARADGSRAHAAGVGPRALGRDRGVRPLPPAAATCRILTRDSILTSFRGASSTLNLISAQLEVVAAWQIPERRRCDSPPNLTARMEAATSQQEAFRLTSSIYGVYQLVAGRIAIVHSDQMLQLSPIPLSNGGWLGVPALAGGVCVDGALRLSRDNYASTTSAGVIRCRRPRRRCSRRGTRRSIRGCLRWISQAANGFRTSGVR